MWKTTELPGNTLALSQYTGADAFKARGESGRGRAVLLATSKITMAGIYNNGLYQNVIIIYRLLEAMKYIPTLLVNNRMDEGDFPAEWSDIRCLTLEEYLQKPFPLVACIEIGMSIDPSIRDVLKIMGAKVVKLYLGNVLNIDIETSIFYRGAELAHHIVGAADELWVSPHYAHHLDYTCELNHVPPEKGAIAPYVWDPMILEASTGSGPRGNPRWRAPTSVDDTQHILIFEPNISFQKCCIVPLAICEAYYQRRRRGANIMVHIFNSDRFNTALYFKESVLKGTQLAQDPFNEVGGIRGDSLAGSSYGRVVLEDRVSVVDLMAKYPSAIVVCHQVANEFNYMVLECLFYGFPVIHNADSWAGAGYYYEGNRIADGADRLVEVIDGHAKNYHAYMSAGRGLLWNHSIHNPDVKRGWEELLLR